ncbi:phosphohydrolase [Rhizobium wuzhouense]|uniref:Phosphohydrolase n=1 Tax=Rhizobium wuzhouense TaxID=1986026 RepID=A0ABX5NM36_9HYPH|nr:phosphohydrolase [Rhizobium wuzhouense]
MLAGGIDGCRACQESPGFFDVTDLLTAEAFAPHQALAAQLLAHATEGDDGSHDLAHIHRVFRNAMRIQAGEGGDAEVLAAAVLLHDCVAVEKNSPLRSQASRLAAEKASSILADLGWPEDRIARVAHAVLTHSFSANIPPETLEAKILQDADRLDAIGMVGVARCFYIAGRLGSGLYHPGDPGADHRPLDDRLYAIDHFPAKLLKLSDGFQTATGRVLAEERHQRLEQFLTLFRDEI